MMHASVFSATILVTNAATDSFSTFRPASCAVTILLTAIPLVEVVLASQEQILHSMFHSLAVIAINPLWPTQAIVLSNQVLIGV